VDGPDLLRALRGARPGRPPRRSPGRSGGSSPTAAACPRTPPPAQRARGARVLAAAAGRLALPAWLTPLVAVVPGPLVAVELARRRDRTSTPGGLVKVTTITTRRAGTAAHWRPAGSARCPAAG